MQRKLEQLLIRSILKKKQYGAAILIVLFIIVAQTNELPGSEQKHIDGPKIEEATLIYIIDGDTIKVMTDHGIRKVRLYNIDAPELEQTYGSKSKETLTSYLSDKQIQLEDKGEDQYGRLLATIYAGKKNINLLMVQFGAAWVSSKFNDQFSFYFAQEEARRMKKGLWSDPKASAPWRWRKKHRENRL